VRVDFSPGLRHVWRDFRLVSLVGQHATSAGYATAARPLPVDNGTKRGPEPCQAVDPRSQLASLSRSRCLGRGGSAEFDARGFSFNASAKGSTFLEKTDTCSSVSTDAPSGMIAYTQAEELWTRQRW